MPSWGSFIGLSNEAFRSNKRTLYSPHATLRNFGPTRPTWIAYGHVLPTPIVFAFPCMVAMLKAVKKAIN